MRRASNTTKMRLGGGGNETERRGVHFTYHIECEKKGEQTQSSLCAQCCAGEKQEDTDGKSK